MITSTIKQNLMSKEKQAQINLINLIVLNSLLSGRESHILQIVCAGEQIIISLDNYVPII